MPHFYLALTGKLTTVQSDIEDVYWVNQDSAFTERTITNSFMFWQDIYNTGCFGRWCFVLKILIHIFFFCLRYLQEQPSFFYKDSESVSSVEAIEGN